MLRMRIATGVALWLGLFTLPLETYGKGGQSGQGNRAGKGNQRALRNGAGRSGKPDRQGRPSREQVLARFDRNNDGQLNEGERRALRNHRRNKPGGAGQQGRPSREQVMARFDRDGNGQLDDAERQALRQAIRKRRDQRDGGPPAQDGQPGAGARKRQGRPDKQQLIDRFDEDGDGRLNEEEMAAARQARAEKRERKQEE